MSVTGERDDLPGGGPQKAGVAITDLMTGMYATVAIQAALAHRDRTGEGQWVDTCLFDSSVAMMSVMNLNYLVTGKPPGRAGNAHPNIVPYQVFACADGHVIVAVGNDGQFAKFCEVGGRPEWAADARYAKNADRVRNRDVLVPLDRRRDAHAHAARVARRAGAARRALRADQQARPGVRRSAARGARHAARSAASARRDGPAGRHADQVLRHDARVRAAAAAPRRTHGRRCCAIVWRCGADAIADLAARGVIGLRA